MPKRLTGLLDEFGIRAQTVNARGWGSLVNGELVEAATEAGFECVLTSDRLFSESAALALKRFPQFSVVLVTLPQLRGPQFLDVFRQTWVREPIRPRPGDVLVWPSS